MINDISEKALGKPETQVRPRTETLSVISGTGSYTPENRLTNLELNASLALAAEFIQTRTGILERRIAAPQQAASDLALIAAKNALTAAHIAADQIDLIVVATVTPDNAMPSVACRLQGMLGCQAVAAFDVNAACSGFVYALTIADNFIRAGSAQTALVVGVDIFSRIMNYRDPTTCILFGDGAGAVVLTAASSGGILATQLHSDGSRAEMISIPAGGSRLPASHDTVAQGLHAMSMRNGGDVFRSAVAKMSECISSLLRENGLSVQDVDLLIPHQANIRIISAICERLGLAPERVFSNLERYGNTSAASVPLALDEAVKGGRICSGDNIVLAAFGAGLTWGSALLRWV